MLLRKIPRHTLQGNNLRKMRRRNYPRHSAPRANGPRRPGGTRIARVVLARNPQPPRHGARHQRWRARKGSLLCRLHSQRHTPKRKGPHQRGTRDRVQEQNQKARGREVQGEDERALPRSQKRHREHPRRRCLRRAEVSPFCHQIRSDVRGGHRRGGYFSTLQGSQS